jgi:hypothetical protein
MLFTRFVWTWRSHCISGLDQSRDAHFLSKSANLDVEQKEDVMAKGNNARKKETKKPKKDKK